MKNKINQTLDKYCIIEMLVEQLDHLKDVGEIYPELYKKE